MTTPDTSRRGCTDDGYRSPPLAALPSLCRRRCCSADHCSDTHECVRRDGCNALLNACAIGGRCSSADRGPQRHLGLQLAVYREQPAHLSRSGDRSIPDWSLRRTGRPTGGRASVAGQRGRCRVHGAEPLDRRLLALHADAGPVLAHRRDDCWGAWASRSLDRDHSRQQSGGGTALDGGFTRAVTKTCGAAASEFARLLRRRAVLVGHGGAPGRICAVGDRSNMAQGQGSPVEYRCLIAMDPSSSSMVTDRSCAFSSPAPGPARRGFRRSRCWSTWRRWPGPGARGAACPAVHSAANPRTNVRHDTRSRHQTNLAGPCTELN